VKRVLADRNKVATKLSRILGIEEFKNTSPLKIKYRIPKHVAFFISLASSAAEESWFWGPY